MTTSSRSGRATAVVNGAVAVGLVTLLVAVALVVAPPSPPGIAEFAPQATKPISKAPLGQTSDNGIGTSSCAPGKQCAPGSRLGGKPVRARQVGSAPTGVPSALQCYSWPDGSLTQTFDPQSPPCIASWPEADKGNGGTTARGVTGTDVTFVATTVSQDDLADARALASFFNTRFQLYGRKIRVEKASGDASTQAQTSQGQRALAADVAQLRAFASTTPAVQVYPSYNSADYTTFIDAAAKRGVITIDNGPYVATATQAARNAPYQWSYAPYLDTIERNAAEFACRALAGRPASHGGPAVQFTTRKFGILYSPNENGLAGPEYATLRDGLASCGQAAPAYEYRYSATDPSANAQTYAQMRQDGITTVFLVASGSYVNSMTTPQDSSYQPEWFILGLDGQTRSATTGQHPEQAEHRFGLNPLDKLLAPGVSPAGVASASVGLTSTNERLYHQLLVLASGVQAAGPHLTPKTFADGLAQLHFPNPGSGQRPTYQASVGFADSSAMIDDIGLLWWDNTQQSPDPVGPGTGAFCSVGGGTRWRLGTWPGDDPGLFDRAKGC